MQERSGIHPVREEDLAEVWAVHLESRNDLLRRVGRVPPEGVEPISPDFRLLHRTDPDGVFAAVEDGEVRGMVAAIVRGPIWFLSSFWVHSAHQGRGLGRPLLERAFTYGHARGARVFSVWASLDPRAQARYVVGGMDPLFPIYRVEGDESALRRLRAAFPELALRSGRIEERIDAEEAARLEAPHWGTERLEEHAQWTREPGTLQVAIREGGRLQAFAYLRGGVFVGPACGVSAEALLEVVVAACARAPRRAILRVPGPASGLLRALVTAGFRPGDLALYMASSASSPLASRETSGPMPPAHELHDRRLPSGPFLY